MYEWMKAAVTPTTVAAPHINSTWPPHCQDAVDVSATTTPTDRPHTISTAYEKGHQRPPLTVYTFQNPETISENSTALNNNGNCHTLSNQTQMIVTAQHQHPTSSDVALAASGAAATMINSQGTLTRPPLPVVSGLSKRSLSFELIFPFLFLFIYQYQ